MPVDVKYCAPHPHIGETLTARYLRNEMPRRSVVLVKYHLPTRSGTLEIDLVVINRNGVYLLEVKHWIGRIQAGQVKWQHSSGDLRDNPVIGIEHKAKVMHSFLDRRDLGYVSVVGLVVLSNNNEIDGNDHKVFKLDESLINALTGRAYVFHPNSPTLSDKTIHRLRKVILDSRVTDAEQRIAGYRILSQKDREYYVDLEAEDPEFAERKVRIKQYDVREISSSKEIEKAVWHFKRDMAALLKAGPHPNLLIPYRFHRDPSSDERYYLVMEWPWGQTLAERIAAGPITWAEQFHILKNGAAALAHCHEQQVIHRNITPYAIYLTDEGRVKVGDFDFAKMPPVTLSLSQTGLMRIAGRHLSPELAFNVHDVDVCADIYSLGVVWYDMLFRPPDDEPLDRGRIAHASLSRSGKKLLCSMLAEPRSERPTSMVEVKDQLERLSKDLH